MSVESKDSVTPESGAKAAMPFFVQEERERSQHQALLANLFGTAGRFSRETFWLVYGVCMLAAFLAPIMGALLLWPYIIAITWVSVAAVIKRFHDRNKSGWWVLVSMIPFIGTIWIMVECGLLEGDAGHNLYGPKALSPKELLQ